MNDKPTPLELAIALEQQKEKYPCKNIVTLNNVAYCNVNGKLIHPYLLDFCKTGIGGKCTRDRGKK